jgi:DNA-binding response OmpR family regulator
MPTSARHTVVLADDIRLSLERERTFFQRSGFDVITANDGLTALALTASVLPDIVILDEYMPGLRGTEICARLRAREETRNTPVIVTSIRDTEELRKHCRAVGVTTFVPKSAGKEALLAIVAETLRVPQRKAIRIPVFFTVVGVVGAKESLGKAVDLSEAGMCLESNRKYPVGAELQLRFFLPGERQVIRANARVQRANQRNEDVYALGLEFDALAENGQQRLNTFIDRSLMQTVSR